MMFETILVGALAIGALLTETAAPTEPPDPLRDPVRVVTTLPIYAELVREIGGSEVEVTSIANPNEDAHFVRPKPSFARDLRQAEAFVTTGLDLELWVPVLLDRAGNRDVLEGGRGYITAYTGIDLLDIPVSSDRSGGDVHIFGNPHLTTDPLRTVQVARNITAGLKRVAPDRAAHFDAGLATFTDRVHRRLFGARLVELLGAQTLEQLALNSTLYDFLGTQEFDGKPLIEEFGWLARYRGALPRPTAHLLPQELGVFRRTASTFGAPTTSRQNPGSRRLPDTWDDSSGGCRKRTSTLCSPRRTSTEARSRPWPPGVVRHWCKCPFRRVPAPGSTTTSGSWTPG